MTQTLGGPYDWDACDYEDRVECPTCRSLVDPTDLREFDLGRSRNNGYHDAGTGCVVCAPAVLLADRWSEV